MPPHLLFFPFRRHFWLVNAVAWAPHELGYPLLACGSSDGDITLLACQDGVWSSQRISKAHQTGVSSVSWAPINLDQKQQDGSLVVRLVSGGCDNKAKARVSLSLVPCCSPVTTRDLPWATGLAHGKQCLEQPARRACEALCRANGAFVEVVVHGRWLGAAHGLGARRGLGADARAHFANRLVLPGPARRRGLVG